MPANPQFHNIRRTAKCSEHFPHDTAAVLRRASAGWTRSGSTSTSTTRRLRRGDHAKQGASAARSRLVAAEHFRADHFPDNEVAAEIRTRLASIDKTSTRAIAFVLRTCAPPRCPGPGGPGVRRRRIALDQRAIDVRASVDCAHATWATKLLRGGRAKCLGDNVGDV